MAGLEKVTEVVGDAGTWTAMVDENLQLWGPNGGYLAVIAMRAAALHAGGRRPASLECHFLGSAKPGEVTLTTHTLRQAKRAHSVQVVMTQNGQPVLMALVWALTDDVDGLPSWSLPKPEVPAPHTLDQADELLGPDRARPGPFWKLFDERPINVAEHRAWPDELWESPTFPAWVRYRPEPRFSDPFVDAGRAVILLDVYPYAAATGVLRPNQITHLTPTISLSVTFHHRQEPESEWMLLQAQSPASGDGLLGGRGTVWGETGELLATGNVQMLNRRLPEL
ncbi:thioesterase family protein [Actinomadura sp. CNU-125]|uniref:thioesterase family protein n=1 Tax=Actinomadura sp. CNU-125 TaxID=1904961 RepID=UPI00096A3B75|nr:thioesterase family protein [Actinomadura sp. CNU-125]